MGFNPEWIVAFKKGAFRDLNYTRWAVWNHFLPVVPLQLLNFREKCCRAVLLQKCCTDQETSVWGWIDDDGIGIFGWTLPLMLRDLKKTNKQKKKQTKENHIHLAEKQHDSILNCATCTSGWVHVFLSTGGRAANWANKLKEEISVSVQHINSNST